MRARALGVKAQGPIPQEAMPFLDALAGILAAEALREIQQREKRADAQPPVPTCTNPQGGWPI